MRNHSKKASVSLLLAVVLTAALAFAGGMLGKLYVKTTEVLLTERSGLVCQTEENNYCERTFRCPEGKIGYALIYNIKEVEGKKELAGMSLVCSDPNAFDQPYIVGAAGDAFAGEEVKDYCPVGYMLAGAEFYTNNREKLSGAKRVCRRYNPPDERVGANLFGEGFDRMVNVCPDRHWVSGLKISFNREQDENGRVDSTLINARFYCSEIRHYLVEPDEEEGE
ncbi:MAG: hypothetical protein ACTSXZ_09250, partial [Alphaproteobacteria bacterium]